MLIDVINWALTSPFMYWMFMIALGIWALNSLLDGINSVTNNDDKEKK